MDQGREMDQWTPENVASIFLSLFSAEITTKKARMILSTSITGGILKRLVEREGNDKMAIQKHLEKRMQGGSNQEFSDV